MIGLLLSDSTYDSFLGAVAKALPQSTLKFLNEKFLFALRRRYLTQILNPHLNDSANVLDLGTSDGRLASNLWRKQAARGKAIRFIGCDVHVQPKTFIPIEKYDGRRLPFEDNSFDCVLIVDVLHHTQDPLHVLQEAKRVSSQYILIKDHYWRDSKDFSMLSFADFIGNKPYGISLPYKFFKCPEWLDLIQQRCGLSIIDFKTFRFNIFDPCKHVLFKVDIRGNHKIYQDNCGVEAVESQQLTPVSKLD
jgi:SAM-dependent methyltransferase